MPSAGGAALRFGSLFLRLLQLCCAIICFGIFTYFVTVLVSHKFHVPTKWQAVEGLTGAALLYTLCAVAGTLFLGGNLIFGTLAILLDLCFIAAFALVAWFTRYGASKCHGNVRTPLGNGESNIQSLGYGDHGPKLNFICRLNTTVFAAAIIAIFLFLLSAIWQIMMVLHHRKEKKAEREYTTESHWERKPRHDRDVETVPVVTPPITRVRPSNETGTTLNNTGYIPESKEIEPVPVITHNAYTTEPRYVEPVPAIPDNTHLRETRHVSPTVAVTTTTRHNMKRTMRGNPAHPANNVYVPEPGFGRPNSRGNNAYVPEPEPRYGEAGYTQPAYDHPVQGQPGYGQTDVTYHDRTTFD